MFFVEEIHLQLTMKYSMNNMQAAGFFSPIDKNGQLLKNPISQERIMSYIVLFVTDQPAYFQGWRVLETANLRNGSNTTILINPHDARPEVIMTRLIVILKLFIFIVRAHSVHCQSDSKMVSRTFISRREVSWISYSYHTFIQTSTYSVLIFTSTGGRLRSTRRLANQLNGQPLLYHAIRMHFKQCAKYVGKASKTNTGTYCAVKTQKHTLLWHNQGSSQSATIVQVLQ